MTNKQIPTLSVDAVIEIANAHFGIYPETDSMRSKFSAAILQAANRDALNNTKSRLIADLIDANEKAARAEMPHINVYACIDIIRQFDFGTTRDAPSADAVDAQRYRWLQQQRARVWHQIAEMPIIRTSEFIDANITAEGRWK